MENNDQIVAGERVFTPLKSIPIRGSIPKPGDTSRHPFYIVLVTEMKDERGLYIVKRKDEIVYVGSCLKTYVNYFHTVVDGIGTLSAIARYGEPVTLLNLFINWDEDMSIYIHPIGKGGGIKAARDKLIAELNPPWN